MFDVLSEISWFAVLAATAALAVLAGAYFGALVPRPYAVVLGRETEPAPAPDALTVAGPVVCSLVLVVTSAVLMAALDVDALGEAVAFGAIVGLGYLVPMAFTIAINPNFPRPLAYGLLSTPYFLAASILTATILQLLS